MRCLLALLLVPQIVVSQPFLSYSLSNNSGVYAVFSNPANAAASTDWLSINGMGAGLAVENNIIRTRLSYSLASTVFYKPFSRHSHKPGNTAPYIEMQPRQPKSPAFFMSMGVLLPAVKINLSPRLSLYAGRQEKTIANVNEAGEQLLQLLVDKRKPDLTQSLSFSTEAKMMGYSENFLGLAAVLYAHNEHVLKGGVTFKQINATYAYLVDVREMGLSIGSSDTTLSSRYRLISVPGLSPLSYVNQPLRGGSMGRGYGIDAGFVYEYRPRNLVHAYSWNNPKGKNRNFRRYDAVKYLYRISFSVMDAGRVDYRQDKLRDRVYEVQASVSPGKAPAEDFLEEMTRDAKVLEEKKGVRLFLPLSFQWSLDWRLRRNWFVNVHYIQNARNKKKAENFYQPSSLSVLLRKEMRNITYGIPLRITPYSKAVTAGALFQAGPFFIVTDNLMLLFKKQMRNVFVSTGLCYTMKYKRDATIENFRPF